MMRASDFSHSSAWQNCAKELVKNDRKSRLTRCTFFFHRFHLLDNRTVNRRQARPYGFSPISSHPIPSG